MPEHDPCSRYPKALAGGRTGPARHVGRSAPKSRTSTSGHSVTSTGDAGCARARTRDGAARILSQVSPAPWGRGGDQITAPARGPSAGWPVAPGRAGGPRQMEKPLRGPIDRSARRPLRRAVGDDSTLGEKITRSHSRDLSHVMAGHEERRPFLRTVRRPVRTRSADVGVGRRSARRLSRRGRCRRPHDPDERALAGRQLGTRAAARCSTGPARPTRSCWIASCTGCRSRRYSSTRSRSASGRSRRESTFMARLHAAHLLTQMTGACIGATTPSSMSNVVVFRRRWSEQSDFSPLRTDRSTPSTATAVVLPSPRASSTVSMRRCSQPSGLGANDFVVWVA